MVKDNALFNDIMTNAGVGGRMVKATASPQCYLWHYILDEPMDIIKVKDLMEVHCKFNQIKQKKNIDN